MSEHTEERQKIKEAIRTAWGENDLISLMCAGVRRLVSMIHENGSAPISFQSFLDHTGLFFDHYISDIGQQEHLDYVGGKMVLQLAHCQRGAVDVIPIRLSAELYFQTADKQWVIKHKRGQIDSTRFTDWNTNETAITLQRTGMLEWSIEPSTT